MADHLTRRDVAITGGCQCGAVRYASSQLMESATICHCRMCQKAMGNAFGIFVSAPDDTLVWTRGAPSVFASSDYAERGFCAACGTPLFYRRANGDRTGLSIGSLDDPSLGSPQVEVGMEGRLAFLDVLPDLPKIGTTESRKPEKASYIRATNHQHPDHDTEIWPSP